MRVTDEEVGSVSRPRRGKTGAAVSLLIASETADPVFPRRGLETLPTSSSVTRIANRSNVSIYVVDPREAVTPAEGPDMLRVLTDDTDGQLIANTPDLEAGLQRMLND